MAGVLATGVLYPIYFGDAQRLDFAQDTLTILFKPKHKCICSFNTSVLSIHVSGTSPGKNQGYGSK